MIKSLEGFLSLFARASLRDAHGNLPTDQLSATYVEFVVEIVRRIDADPGFKFCRAAGSSSELSAG
jgi:hypothetical protein